MNGIGYGLDDHVSWYYMYGIGERTRRSRLLVVYERYWCTDYTITSLGSVCTVLGHGIEDHMSR